MSPVRVRRTPRFPRAAAVLAIATATVALTALPAAAHAGFKAYSAFNNLPNPSGGSNAGSGDQSTAPYAAGSVVSLAMRSAVEVPGGSSWDPALYSNVDVKVTVPAGWTNPTCGSANLQVNDVSTGSTNQPGAAVAGWQCEVYVSAGRAIVHFWGPPVATGGLTSDAAQYFLFSITTPMPTVQTTYGVGGTEGFIADQQYADGNISHWYPSADYVGTYPPGALPTTPAGGLLRTVAAFDPASTSTATDTPSTPRFTG